jgi:hypothetical protein
MSEHNRRYLLKTSLAADGRHERFKSTQLFDGPYHRVQHGLTQKDVEGT